MIFPSKNDKEQWLYHLTVVSGGDPKAGTALEQLIQKLMEEDGNPQSVIWRHPLMTYSKDPISTSLTTFTSEELQNEAVKLFKVISQCSKIRKKCKFKSTKTLFCYFKNGKKSIFAPEESPKIAFLVFLNFFLVQKLIFCHF